MEHTTALHLLGLKDQVSPPQLREAFEGKRTQLERRLSDAPTEGLKIKYRQELAELQQAFDVASGAGRDAVAGLSATMVRDLPGARPVYTQDYGSHEPAAGARLTLSEGQVLADRYEVRRKLGAGGMGAVFAALDRNRDQEVAIKVLLPGLLRDPQARQRFMDEAKLSADLSHPHIVNVYDVQKDGDLHFITMELLEGRTLRQEMETRKQLKKPFTVEEVKSLASQLCEALSYAHKTTVHRDVKPENIWLQPDDNVKLMDFGIARLLSTSQLTMTGTSMGTAYYMAPEQLKGAKNVDGRADQYALAAIMYEMFTGDVPAGRMTPAKQARRDVPATISDALDKALSSKPENRFTDVESLGAALGRSRLLAPSKRTTLIASVAAGILVMGLAIVLSVSNKQKQGSDAQDSQNQHASTDTSITGKDQEDAQEVPLAKVSMPKKVGDTWTNGVGMTFAYVPAGTFTMGSPASEYGRYNNEVQHKVTLTKAFCMGTTPVTQGQWKVVMGNNPSHFQGDDLPVETVRYDDAIAFCNALSQKEKKRYRLPTEAEWEYACRAGTTTAFYTGDGDQALDQAGWYSANSNYQTHPVGQKKANSWGLYDTHGNVSQWCIDWLGNYPTEGGRVLRGGSWYSNSRECRCADRYSAPPDYRSPSFGFRVTLESD